MGQAIKLKKLSTRERELMQMPTLASQTPVVFNESAEFSQLTAYCKMCDHEVPESLVTGKVVHLNAHTASVEGVAVCPACKIATPINYRLHSDGRVSGPSPTTGKWGVWGARNKTLMKYICDLLLFRA